MSNNSIPLALAGPTPGEEEIAQEISPNRLATQTAGLDKTPEGKVPTPKSRSAKAYYVNAKNRDPTQGKFHPQTAMST